jgi:putative ATPase
MEDLFSKQVDPDDQMANRCAPQSIDEFFGQEGLLGNEGALRRLIESDRVPSSIFYGPPGCGKTALALIIARRTKSAFIRMNAVTAKTEDLRNALKRAEANRSLGTRTLLFIDEIHRFNKMVQDGLLPALEQGLVTLIGTTTKNPFFYLIPPLRSRVLLFEFHRLSEDALGCILNRAQEREGFSVDKEARNYLVTYAGGDARRLFNLLEAARSIEKDTSITLQSIELIVGRQQLLYDRDENYHYDVISAFIKSVRGTDPDAALYWLALMIEAGEDPLYIARRLVILASEDIGLADATALPLAVSAYEAVDMVGMPEARIILAHATLHLTLAPKSNSSYTAVERATSFVKERGSLEVPDYLKSSPRAGKHYRYPHDFQYHYVVQRYLQEKVSFYEPGVLGEEKEMKRRLEFLRTLYERGDKFDAQGGPEKKDGENP